MKRLLDLNRWITPRMLALVGLAMIALVVLGAAGLGPVFNVAPGHNLAATAVEYGLVVP